MARSDWAALLTDPAQEYLAHTELRRFGLEPYLPQLKKRHHTRAGTYVMRYYPLFPRYLLIPVNSVYDPSVRMARGICKHRHVLADAEGRPWRAPNRVIEAVMVAERSDRFSEFLQKGDQVALARGVLSTVRSVMSSDTSTGMVSLLMPLFNGCRGSVSAAKIVHI
jgi:hypothetical protein